MVAIVECAVSVRTANGLLCWRTPFGFSDSLETVFLGFWVFGTVDWSPKKHVAELFILRLKESSVERLLPNKILLILVTKVENITQLIKRRFLPKLYVFHKVITLLYNKFVFIIMHLLHWFIITFIMITKNKFLKEYCWIHYKKMEYLMR